MAKCTECGAVVADDLKFCGYCGAKLNIIGEHLGTQILGNTQVIMGALERIAPGAARRYTVLGTAGDGPLAGGLILGVDANPSGRPWATLHWSDGEKLTKVAADHVKGCFERGTLAFNPELIDTCEVCLNRYHRVRRVEGFWGGGRPFAESSAWGLAPSWDVRNSVGQKPSWDEQFGWWTRPFTGRGCPDCCSSALLSPEYRAFVIERQESPLRVLQSNLENQARNLEYYAGRKRDMSGFHQTRERRKQLRDEEAPRARRDARRVASLLGDLEDSVDHDQKVFRAFAATLPSMQLQPPSYLADWTAFQRHFYLMAMEVKTGVVGCGIPLSHSMSEKARRA